MDFSSIQKKIDQIEKLEEENKISKEMLKAELENDESYVQVSNTVKEANKKKKSVKETILLQEDNKKIVEDIKENTEEISTLKEILSTELIDLYQKQKVEEIPDPTGFPRKFKVLVRLLPKRNYSSE
jgi:hypothetical protein